MRCIDWAKGEHVRIKVTRYHSYLSVANDSRSRRIMPAMTKEQLEHFEHFGFVTADQVLDPEERSSIR